MKFNKLGLALVTNLKLYTSLPKRLKLKVKKFWGLISYVRRSYREKTGRGLPPPPPILNRVKNGVKTVWKSL